MGRVRRFSGGCLDITATASGGVLYLDSSGNIANEAAFTYNDSTNVLSVDNLDLLNALPATEGGTGFSSYAVGDILYANTTTTLAKLADIATGNALISGGVNTAPSWGKIGLTTHVSGTLPVGSGGTGATSFTTNSIIFMGATTLSQDNARFSWTDTPGTLTVFGSSDSGTNKVLNIASDNGANPLLEIYDGIISYLYTHLYFAYDNLRDIGNATNRVRTIYAGTSLGIATSPSYPLDIYSLSNAYAARITAGGLTDGGMLITTSAYDSGTVPMLQLQDQEGGRTVFHAYSTIDIDNPQIDITANMDFINGNWDITTTGDYYGGSATLSDLTTTGVLYASTSGLVRTDSTYLSWDDTNKKLSVTGTNTTDAIVINGYGDGGFITRGYLKGVSATSSRTLWILSDDASGAYGLMAVGGSSSAPASGGRVFEFDAFDVDIVGDQRTGSFVNEKTGSAYYWKFVTRPSGFFDNAFVIHSNTTRSLIGIGIAPASITAQLHIAAGKTTANTAPIKLTTGSYTTAATAGQIEWHSATAENLTFSPSTTRYRIPMVDSGVAGLTSGRVPFATTNGRLTDLAAFTYSTNRLSPTYITLAAGTATAGTAPLVFTSGTVLSVAIAGAMEYDGTDLFFSPSTTRYSVPLVSGAGVQGDIIYASAASVYSRLAKNTTATRYLSNTGTSNNPAWAQIDLTNGVTGALPIANGGTGQTSQTNAFDALAPTTTQGDLIYHNGTDNVRLAKGTAGQVLAMNSGATAPEWVANTGTTYIAYHHTTTAPADSTTYYIGSSLTVSVATTNAIQRVYIAKTGTVKAIYIFAMVAGTLASGESSTMAFRLNDTTDTTISSAVTHSAVSAVFSNTGLSISVTAGDYFEIKWTTPAWVTNPTNVRHHITVYVE